MKKTPIHFLRCTVGFMLAVLLGACAQINNYGMETLASTASTAAIINGSLLQGKVTLYTNRSGAVSLESADEPPLTCFANMRFTATQSGVMNFKCSDGSAPQLSFVMLTELSGYASGAGTSGPQSLVYGLKGTASLAYLVAPKGKTLAASPDGQLSME
jgi:hypothetical protein